MALDFAATYKVLVLGDSNVGKTCIVHRYCDERYYDTYISTIGKYNAKLFYPACRRFISNVLHSVSTHFYYGIELIESFSLLLYHARYRFQAKTHKLGWRSNQIANLGYSW